MQIESLLYKIKQYGVKSLSDTEISFIEKKYDERAYVFNNTKTSEKLVVDYGTDDFFIKDMTKTEQHIADLLLVFLPWIKYKPLNSTYDESVLFSPIYTSSKHAELEIMRVTQTLEKVLTALNKEYKSTCQILCNVYSCNDKDYLFHPTNGLTRNYKMVDENKNYLFGWLNTKRNVFCQQLLPVKDSTYISDSLYYGNKYKLEKKDVKINDNYFTFTLESLYHSI